VIGDDIRAVLEQPNGILMFNGTPLGEAAHDIERHFDIRIRLMSPALEKRLVTASFAGERLEVVLTTVCRVTETSCSWHGDTLSMAP